MVSKNKMNTKEFIRKLKSERFIDEDYLYDKVVYVNDTTKVIITCKKHGDFEQTPHYIRRKDRGGCPLCRRNKSGYNVFDIKTFIKKANEIHGNKYLYNKATYIGSNTKVTITCREHGDFKQTPNTHIHGAGCPLCAREKVRDTNTYTINNFIESAKKIHGDRYDYSKSIYVNNKTKLTIICKEHGEFEQSPNRHNAGSGCPLCGKLLVLKEIDNKKYNTEDFIKRAKEIHEDFYDYSKVNYIDANTKIDIICPIHGKFTQLPKGHLSGKRCLKCAKKNPYIEEVIKDFLIENNIDFIEHDREILDGKEIDIYLPDYKFGIECHGNYWHSDALPANRKSTNRSWLINHMKDKFINAEKKDVRLVQFYEDEILQKLDIIKKMILFKSHIGLERVFARKTTVVDDTSKYLTKTTVNNFLNKNHIQGACAYKFAYGLLSKNTNELLAVMLFNYTTSNRGSICNGKDWELVRFASDKQIVGGASKLLTAFCLDDRINEIANIVSYSDNRISDGQLYKSLGFELEKEVPPDYYYIDITNNRASTKRFHKSYMKKSNQAKRFSDPDTCKSVFDPNLTEYINANANGFFRIYNAGLRKWILTDNENF